MNHAIHYLDGNLQIERFGAQYIAYSNVKASHIINVFPSFSIKYVFEGELSYKIRSGNHRLKKNDILYAAAQPGEVCFNVPSKNAIGLCIGLNEELFLEALRVRPGNELVTDPENVSSGFREFPQFLEGIHNKQDQKLGRLLSHMAHKLGLGASLRALIREEWFLDLAAEIVRQEAKDFVGCRKLKTAKFSTRKELIKRLSVAKQYMDDCFLLNPMISEVAQTAMLSEYHFFRSFKAAYGISPYQYLMDRRLDYAKNMVIESQKTFREIAQEIGFSDQYSFSKAFKNKFQVSPNYYSSDRDNCIQ
jgi:AraC family transcriptional regulator